MIEYFKGEYAFLSNFYPCAVQYEGLNFSSVEHAYQAAKTLDIDMRSKFSNPLMTAGQAKRCGKLVNLRPDWEQIKLIVMNDLIAQKFSNYNQQLKDKLIQTGDVELVEGNWWRDTFWGVYITEDKRIGENNLGKILMNRRALLKSEIFYENGV